VRTPTADISKQAPSGPPAPPPTAARAPSTPPPAPGSDWASTLVRWCRGALRWLEHTTLVGDCCPGCGAPSDRFASVVSTPVQPGDPTVAMRCGICDTEWRRVAVWPICEF